MAWETAVVLLATDVFMQLAEPIVEPRTLAVHPNFTLNSTSHLAFEICYC